jgi:hypothetical protein
MFFGLLFITSKNLLGEMTQNIIVVIRSVSAAIVVLTALFWSRHTRQKKLFIYYLCNKGAICIYICKGAKSALTKCLWFEFCGEQRA